MSATKIIIEKTQLREHSEGDWSNTESKYTAFNDSGVEVEVGEFLYSMVRLLKPKRVLESGTCEGIGAMYISLALKDNEEGLLTTVEFNRTVWAKAVQNLGTLGVDEHVDLLCMDMREYKTSHKFQLIFLDTEPDLRFDEFIRYHNNLEEGGFIFIHDLHRHMSQLPNVEHGFGFPYGKLPQKMINLVKEYYSPVHFSTPRGLSGFYKKHKDDYKWQG